MTKVFAYVIALALLAGVFYALVLSPNEVEADVKLWLTGAAGAAITFVFGDQASSRGARQALAAPSQTVTATGDPPTVTVSASEPQSDPTVAAG